MMVSAGIEGELTRCGQRVRSGVFVAVVGPSGAGKDTLIQAAGRSFHAADGVLFVRRAITRPAEPDGENHHALTDVEFEAVRKRGGFAVTWTAHGLSYGIPAEIDSHIARGQVAVVNVSRAILRLVAERYCNLMVVNIEAPRDVLAARLAQRGRESASAIDARLARAEEQCADLADGAVTIENTGPVETGGARLAAEIRRAIAFAAVSDAL